MTTRHTILVPDLVYIDKAFSVKSANDGDDKLVDKMSKHLVAWTEEFVKLHKARKIKVIDRHPHMMQTIPPKLAATLAQETEEVKQAMQVFEVTIFNWCTSPDNTNTKQNRKRMALNVLQDLRFQNEHMAELLDGLDSLVKLRHAIRGIVRSCPGLEEYGFWWQHKSDEDKDVGSFDKFYDGLVKSNRRQQEVDGYKNDFKKVMSTFLAGLAKPGVLGIPYETAKGKKYRITPMVKDQLNVMYKVRFILFIQYTTRSSLHIGHAAGKRGTS